MKLARHSLSIVSLILLLSSCELFFPERVSEQEIVAGTINGSLTLPADSTIDLSELAIEAGLNGTFTCDSDGSYSLEMKTDAPVLAIATTPQRSPILLNVFDATAEENDLNVATTASTMVFMGLGLYSENPTSFKNLLITISAVSEVEHLTEILDTKLSANPDILSADPPDNDIVNALDSAMQGAREAIDSSGILTSARGNSVVSARSVTVDPESQSGLAISVNSSQRATATNTKLRFVGVTVNGPDATDVDTLVAPCSPPSLLLQPRVTVLNPIPLSEPPAGTTYTYEVRARGGLDNSNGLFDAAEDQSPLIFSLSLSGFFDFVLPVFNLCLGSSFSDSAAVELSKEVVSVFSLPFTMFATGAVDGATNGDLDLRELSTQFLHDTLASFAANWPGLAVDLSTYLGTQVTETVLANSLGPISIVLRVISLASNASTMVVGAVHLGTTSMVDVYTISSTSELVELKDDDGTSESAISFGGSCPLSSGDLSDGAIGFRKFLTSPSYPFKLHEVRVNFNRKNQLGAGFYLHIRDDSGNELLPTPFLVSPDEVSLGWWEKDISSYDIVVDSGRIEVGIYESYLLQNCPPDVVYGVGGWSIYYDTSSSGNSILKYPSSSYYPDYEFMIRLAGEI